MIRLIARQQPNRPSRSSTRKGQVILALTVIVIAMLINVSSTLAATATLLRKPYVQQVSTDSLIVAWTTVESGASEVRYGNSDYSQTAAATSTLYTTGESAPYDSYYQHEATLTGLSANSVYQYKIYTNGIDITPEGSINVRSAKSSSSTSFRFAAIGDSGQGNQAQMDVAERLLQVQPEVVVHTGDVVYGGSTYTNYEEKYFQIYADLIESVWLAPSPGNHDTDVTGGQSYVDVFVNPDNGASGAIEREMYYSFDYANAHFSVVTPEVSFGTSSAQYNWLENDLANTSQYWKFVVFHLPPYYTTSSQSFSKNGSVVSALVPLFQSYDVDIVFGGDRHWYERLKPLKDDQQATIEAGGILYVVTGGGGAGLAQIGSPPWNELTAEKARLYHFTMLDVNGCEAQLSAVVKTESGDSFDNSDIFDSYTLDRCEGPPVADFTSDVTSGDFPLTVNFEDLSSRGPTNWSWTFGDGGSSTDQHPSHTYNAAGTYTVSLTAGNNAGDHTETKSNYIEVTAPPPPTARFTTTAFEIGESGSPMVTVSVELTWPHDSPISVNYTTSDDTAVAPGDYTPSSGPLLFAPSETIKTFTVSIKDDGEIEDAEQINLTLSGASVSEPSSATITILDDDTPPEIRFSQAQYDVNENDGTADIVVELSHAFHTPISVVVSSSDGTAKAGADYTAVNDTITFTPGGTTSQTISIPLVDNGTDEDPESFSVNLNTPTVASLGTPAAATVSITDDDPAPTISFKNAAATVGEAAGSSMVMVALNAISDKTVSVDLSSKNGTAQAGDDYTAVSESLTFLPGETSQTIAVPILEDVLDEADETFLVELRNAQNGSPTGPATITIVDNDEPPQLNFALSSYNVNENGGVALLTVQLSAISGREVTVAYAVSGGTAVSGSDYEPASGVLTFAPGEVSSTFSVTALDDAVEENNETILLALGAAQNGSIGANNTATVTILDDEGPPVFQFSAPTFSASEGDPFGVMNVVLAGSSENTVVVGFSISAGTAVAGSDFAVADGSLSFGPGVTSQEIQIPLLDNSVSEGEETLTVTLSNVSFGFPGTPIVAQLVITDDDPLPVANLDIVSQRVSETVGDVTLTVQLSALSEQTIEVEYIINSSTAVLGSARQVSDGKVTFAPGEEVKMFQVAITDDLLDEPDEHLIVSLVNPKNGSVGPQGSAEIVVEDNDPPVSVAFAAADYAQNEGSGAIVVDVVLSGASGQVITVKVASQDITARAGSDYVAVDDVLTFAAGETSKTIGVQLLDDSEREAGESLSLRLSDAQQANLLVPDVATLTLVDNDGFTTFLPLINRAP